MSFTGIIPVLPTPLTQEGAVDPAGTKCVIDYLVKEGAGGLFVLGSGGEFFNMDYDLRLAATRAVVEATAGRIPLLIGASDYAESNIHRFFRDTKDLKVDAYHVLLLDQKLGQPRVIEYYTRLADASPSPVWIYYQPNTRGNPMAMATVEKLKEHENIQGMKAGGYSLKELLPLLAMNDDTFQVIGAGGTQIIPFLVMGATGHTASTASCFPAPHIDVFNTFMGGDREGAVQKQRALTSLLGKIPKPSLNGENSAEEKAVLELRGLCGRWCAPPYRSFSDAEMGQMRAVLEEAGISI